MKCENVATKFRISALLVNERYRVCQAKKEIPVPILWATQPRIFGSHWLALLIFSLSSQFLKNNDRVRMESP